MRFLIHLISLAAFCLLLGSCLISPTYGSDIQELRSLHNAYVEAYVEHLGAGRCKVAERVAREMIALADRSYRLGPTALAASFSALADVHLRQDRRREAKPLYRRSLDLLVKELGADHPSVLKQLSDLAFLELDEYQFNEARSLCERGLVIAEKSVGHGDKNVAVHVVVSSTLPRFGPADRRGTSQRTEQVPIKNRWL